MPEMPLFSLCHFSPQVNASALASPLSTDVTLISHKVEFSEDSSFASSDTTGAHSTLHMALDHNPPTECSIEGFTPIAGQMPFITPLLSLVLICRFSSISQETPSTSTLTRALFRSTARG
jgi:hypothetical protein